MLKLTLLLVLHCSSEIYLYLFKCNFSNAIVLNGIFSLGRLYFKLTKDKSWQCPPTCQLASASPFLTNSLRNKNPGSEQASFKFNFQIGKSHNFFFSKPNKTYNYQYCKWWLYIISNQPQQPAVQINLILETHFGADTDLKRSPLCNLFNLVIDSLNAIICGNST